MKVYVCIKSGTGGYSDYDNCDLHIQTLEVSETPRVGDTISINCSNKPIKSYLVREVNRHYNIPEENESWDGCEFITAYVIPC